MQSKLRKLSNKLYWTLVRTARGRGFDSYEVKDGDTTLGEIASVRNGIIEPRWGFVLGPGGMPIEDSLTDPTNTHRPPIWRFASPGPQRYREATKLKRVIQLRDAYEWNYFHFHVDVLAKLTVLDAAGIEPDVPIVVGRFVEELPFGREMLDRLDRPWIVQHGAIIADEVVFVRTRVPAAERIKRLSTTLGVLPPTGNQKIFLNRSERATRRIVNLSEVRDVLSDYDEVDPAAMPLSEQIDLFRTAGDIVGIHGAGLTNIAYRVGSDLSVTELYPANYNTFDYRNICDSLGWQWFGIPGQPGVGNPQHVDFEVPIDALAETLRASRGRTSSAHYPDIKALGHAT